MRGAVTPGWQTRPMAFGQASGPPASRRQVETLTELVRAAGHTDFRDARGPLGLNQRQAGGRFTRDEADALIARLEADADTDPRAATGADAGDAGATPSPLPAPTNRRDAQLANSLHRVPAELLAAELQRRGWAVMEP
jgi:hypothetical protein